MTTRTPCSGVAPSGTHKKTDLAYTRPATYPAQRPCLRASLKGGVLSLIRPLHPDNISFALLCALPCALAGTVSATRIATARLVFVIVYSISATPKFHKICLKVKKCDLCEGHRFDLRFLRPFRALSIRKSSSFFPPLIAATSQRGFASLPAQVSPDGPRYFGGTFLLFKTLRRPRTTLRPPTKASILSNCFCTSARCSRSISSTRCAGP